MIPVSPAALSAFEDGALLLDDEGACVDVNEAALRLLGGARDGAAALAVLQTVEGFSESIRATRRNELAWRGVDGRNVLVSLRPRGDEILIILRDLDALDFARLRAGGKRPTVADGHLSGNRTRPDFALQRRLSPGLHRVLSRGERAVQQGARVLITGESGVGKSEIARFLHHSVADGRDPFLVCNCAMSTAQDLSAALFGTSLTPGLAASAAGGTLFLDEIAEVPLSVQAQLLGYLEDGRQPWPSGTAQRAATPRVIAATGADLMEKVRAGTFRADLYYRLAVIELSVPPLRRMPELVEHLTGRFLKTANQRRTTSVVLPQRFHDILGDYAFPGNIRELLNIIQKATIFIEDAADMEELIADLIRPIEMPQDADLPDTMALDLKTEVRRFERALIDKAIRIHGSKRQAAKALGVDIGTIVRKTA